MLDRSCRHSNCFRLDQSRITCVSRRLFEDRTPSSSVVSVCTWLTTSLCITGFKLTLHSSPSLPAASASMGVSCG